MHPFSALNPDCSFVWFWDSPWYLVILVADGTILCDAYSTPTMWSRFYALHVPESVSVACSPMFTSELWKGWVVSPWPWHLQELFWRGCEYLYSLLTNMYRQFVLSWCTFELCYWPARSFSRVPLRHASLLCQWVLLHCWLTLMWRSCKMLSLLGSHRCYRPTPLSVW